MIYVAEVMLAVMASTCFAGAVFCVYKFTKDQMQEYLDLAVGLGIFTVIAMIIFMIILITLAANNNPPT